MLNNKLSVIFIWHMHQPFYKELVNNEYLLPWVRLHAIKDYYDLPAILEKYPKIKQNFNLVPSLLMQIEEYASGNFNEHYFQLSKKEPSKLTLDDKCFMLKNFFVMNWETMVKPYTRFNELLLKRGVFVNQSDLEKAAKKYTKQDFLDLQVWSNLVWFGPVSRKDAFIQSLFLKGKNFTKAEKDRLLELEIEVIKKIIPKYKELVAKKQIEISATPFYHPILPLLCDNQIAKISMPGITFPENNFKHPEDAKKQVEMAVEYFTELFGQAPNGMWPSEGSVSEEIIPILAQAGMKWIATDEEILLKTIRNTDRSKKSLEAKEMYQAYRINKNNSNLIIFFRDHKLSDRVGFVYSKWNGKQAAEDLISILENIYKVLPDDKKYVVPIILDGENAWEYYPDGAEEFFNELFKQLSDSKNIVTTTVSEYIEDAGELIQLPNIYPGSWINSDFHIWIGHEEDNLAWDYLFKTRNTLVDNSTNVPEEKLKIAWQEIYIAEGSDWCWWFGADHSSENDAIFDELYRQHLKNVYQIIGMPIPSFLNIPIKKVHKKSAQLEPTYLINPVIDGEVTSYFEWLQAGWFNIEKSGESMHRTDTVVNQFFYGFNLENIYVRIDFNLNLKQIVELQLGFCVEIVLPQNLIIKLTHPDENKQSKLLLLRKTDKEVEFIKELNQFAINNIVELAIPFGELDVEPGDEVGFNVLICKEGKELERWPRNGYISFNVPDQNFFADNWSA